MAQSDYILDAGLNEVAELITEALKTELIKQGHRATGKLINSIKAIVINTVSSSEVLVSYLDYGQSVNKGQPPGTRVPLQDLVRWVKVKGIATKWDEIQPAARAIQRAIYRYGTPTPGRRANYPGESGRLTGFQDIAVEEETGKISQTLSEWVHTYANQLLTNILSESGPIEIRV